MADRDAQVPGGFVAGVPKKIDIDLMPANLTAFITARNVSIIIENTNPGAQPFNICCAGIGYVGANYPCINHTGLGFTRTTFNLSTLEFSTFT